MSAPRGFDLCRAAMAVTGISAPEQSVLLTLAVMANVDARCWPGINGPAGLTGKTKLSERTVQRAVQGLKDAGHINWVDIPGRGRTYVVHPRHSDTSAEPAPVTVTPRQTDTRHSDTPVTVTPTPVTVTPKQPRTTNTSPVASQPTRSRARKAPAFVPPSDIPESEWEGFEEMRNRIGKPMTPRARDLAIARLRQLAEDGYPPGDVLNHSILNNYQGLFAPRDDRNGQRNGTGQLRNGGSASGYGVTVDAFADFVREASAH